MIPQDRAGRAPGPRVIRMLAALGSAVGAVGVAALLVHTVANAVARFVWGGQIAGTIEVVSYWWMVLISLAPLAAVELRGEHIDAPVVVERLGPRGRRLATTLARVVVVVVAATAACQTLPSAIRAVEIGERAGVAGLVVWPLRLVLPASFGTVALVAASGLVRTVRGRSLSGAQTGEPAFPDDPHYEETP